LALARIGRWRMVGPKKKRSTTTATFEWLVKENKKITKRSRHE
jgi:hypothetical protein